MRCLSSLTLLCLCLLPLRVFGVGIMVNEFRNTNGTVAAGTRMVRDEYIEFVITDTSTAAELSALTFGGTNDATSQLQGVFQFDQATLQSVLATSGVSAFQAGTIIVVKGSSLGSQNLSYNPLNNNLSDADAWSIELVAGQGARDHAETRINGNINVGVNGEVVWISSDYPPVNNTDTSSFIYAMGYDNSPGLIANNVISKFGTENVLRSTVATGNSISNTGGATETLGVSTTGSMGVANSVANSTWIVGGLRTTAALGLAPEPARASLFAVGLAMTMFRRRKQK